MKLNIITVIISVLFITGQALSVEKQKAPNFSLKTADGKVIELAKLKGKVVVINFWATWCPPCRAEIPDFIKVYDQYKLKGLEIVGIALDKDGWDAVKSFINKMRINYPIVLGNENITRLYGNIKGIPTTFIIDKNGYIVDRQAGKLSKQALEQILKPLLKK
jgi:cytochrome c biogenesis protein CcmG/thiol:disulfide interchange protein DsbE